jgi:tRNA A-37 threonylcarbamoyl transferase component Bud32
MVWLEKSAREVVRIEPQYAALVAQAQLQTVRDFVGRFVGNAVVRPNKVLVKPGHLAGTPVFYKQYEYRPRNWWYFFRQSKARREFENYAVLAGLGIATAERIAFGEIRDRLFRVRRSVLVTRQVPGAQPWREAWAESSPPQRRALLQQLAEMTRRIHAAGFYHYDLYFRNLLVTQTAAGPAIWWIDCPRGRWVSWPYIRRHFRCKDLATLDRSAVDAGWSRATRLRFLLAYLQRSRVDREVRYWCRAVPRYRRRRWPGG